MVIGDVVGRGIPAAATMGRLRNALRAYAIDGAAPDEVVARVHRLTDAFEDVSFATFLYLLLDAASGEARYAAAGHPPPLVVPARGEAAYASLRPGPPLGAPALVGWPRSASSSGPEAPSSCTRTGWSRRRDGRIGDGLAQLARAGEARAGGVEALTDRILSHLAADRGWPDDIALLTLRSPARRRLSGGSVRTLVVSDLHLGARLDRDVLRRPPALEALLEALRDVDRLVLLGDVVELLEQRPRRAMDDAEAVVRAIGARLGTGREVVIVPATTTRCWCATISARTAFLRRSTRRSRPTPRPRSRA
jgi:hypothetical protein